MPMRMVRHLMTMIIIFLEINQIFSTHFRGGTFYWAPVSNIATATINISIIQSYSWVRTYAYCDSTTIATQGSIGDNSSTLQCSKFYIIEIKFYIAFYCSIWLCD